MRLCVLSALFVCFYGHWGSSQLSGLLRPAASITPISNVGEGESEKSIRSFPLIMCVYSITVSKQTVLFGMTTAQRGLNYCILHIQWNTNVISLSCTWFRKIYNFIQVKDAWFILYIFLGWLLSVTVLSAFRQYMFLLIQQPFNGLLSLRSWIFFLPIN